MDVFPVIFVPPDSSQIETTTTITPQDESLPTPTATPKPSASIVQGEKLTAELAQAL